MLEPSDKYWSKEFWIPKNMSLKNWLIRAFQSTSQSFFWSVQFLNPQFCFFKNFYLSIFFIEFVLKEERNRLLLYNLSLNQYDGFTFNIPFVQSGRSYWFYIFTLFESFFSYVRFFSLLLCCYIVRWWILYIYMEGCVCICVY